MHSHVAARPTTTTTEQITKHQVLDAVAMAIRAHGMRNLGGIDRIEDLHFKEVADLPIAGTVFATIHEELTILGIKTEETVGRVLEGLGLPYGSELAAHQAHEIGCHCHGQFISSDIAAQRILNLKRVI